MDKLKIKFIAGRIIPAMATTTAMVVGLVSIEILKYILKRPFETFKSSFSNLSRPFWLLTDPDPAKKNI